MPVYTEPKVWRDQDIIPNSDVNAYVGENAKALYSPPAARVYRHVGFETQSESEDTAVPYTRYRFDNDGMWDPSKPTGLTCRTPGVFLIIGMARWQQESLGVRRTLRLRVNGDTHIASQTTDINENVAPELTCPTLWPLRAGDFVEMYCSQDAGVPLEIEAVAISPGDFYSPELMMIRVGGLDETPTWTDQATWADKQIPNGSDFNKYLGADGNYIWNPPCVRVSGNEVAANNIASGTTGVALTFAGARWDTDPSKMWAVANPTRLTFNQAGVYLVIGNGSFAAGAGGTRRGLKIRLGGTTVIGSQVIDASESMQQEITVCTLYNFTAGQYVELLGVQDSGAANQVQLNDFWSPEFMAVRIGTDATTPTWTPPVRFDDDDTITHTHLNTYLKDNYTFLYTPPAARAQHGADQALNNGSLTQITFTAADRFDTDAIHDTATNPPRLTAQKIGIYLGWANLEFTSSDTGTGRVVRIRKYTSAGGGGEAWASMGVPAAEILPHSICTLTLVPMAVGEYLECAGFVDAAGLNALNTDNYSPEFAMAMVGA